MNVERSRRHAIAFCFLSRSLVRNHLSAQPFSQDHRDDQQQPQPQQQQQHHDDDTVFADRAFKLRGTKWSGPNRSARYMPI